MRSAVVAADPASSAQKVAAALDRTVASILRHERRYLFAALAVFLLLALYQCIVTPLWFDEFLTLFIARLPSAHAMLRAIPADGQPPLQYFLTHPLLVWFGFSELVLRLPEVLAYMLAGLCAWRIARVHGNPIQALFATVSVMGGIAIYLAYTARPYEMLFAFTVAAFASWQAACLSVRRRILPLAALTFFIAASIFTHYFGIIHIGVFLLAGEGTRILRRRRPDFPMLAAIVVGLLPLFITAGMARQSSVLLRDAIRQSTHFWARPSPLDLFSYGYMVPPALLVATFALWFTHKPRFSDPRIGTPVPTVPVYEWAAVGALCLLLPAQILIAYCVTGYSQPRYAISTSLGLALLATWGLPRVPRLRPGIQPAMGIAAVSVLVLILCEVAVAQFHRQLWRPQPAADAVSPVLSAVPPGSSPIVVANAFDYPADWWYSPPPLRERLIYLSDTEYAVRQSDFLPELSLMADREVVPMPIAPYSAFVAGHPHFLLFCSGAARLDWTCSRLAHDGSWHLTLIGADSSGGLYRVDRNPEPEPK